METTFPPMFDVATLQMTSVTNYKQHWATTDTHSASAFHRGIKHKTAQKSVWEFQHFVSNNAFSTFWSSVSSSRLIYLVLQFWVLCNAITDQDSNVSLYEYCLVFQCSQTFGLHSKKEEKQQPIHQSGKYCPNTLRTGCGSHTTGVPCRICFHSPTRPRSSPQSRRSPVSAPPSHVCSWTVAGKDKKSKRVSIVNLCESVDFHSKVCLSCWIKFNFVWNVFCPLQRTMFMSCEVKLRPQNHDNAVFSSMI